MRCGCLVGADCAQGGEDTACDDDEQQDCCQGDGPGAAAAVFFVFVILVDAGGFGVRGAAALSDAFQFLAAVMLSWLALEAETFS